MKGWAQNWGPARYSTTAHDGPYQQVELIVSNYDCSETLTFKYHDWLEFLAWASAEFETIKRHEARNE